MYSIYLDKVLLPIAPKSIKIGFSSQNKTLNLINHGEINILKDPGLLDIEFDAMLPNTKYPFSIYKDGFESADKFIDKIKYLSFLKIYLYTVDKVLVHELTSFRN